MNTMKTRQEIKQQAREAFRMNSSPAIVVYLLFTVAGIAVTYLTVGVGSLLLMPVITVAMKGFYHHMYVYRGQGRAEDAVRSAFDERYLVKTGGYLWMGLLTFLWSLLFLIPGIVMGIGYSMTPYILHDCPRVKAMDACHISYRITRGYKVDLLIAALSFIGWELLSALTMGILGILFVGPYREMTFGGIYEELKKEAIANGTLNIAELTDVY